MPNKAYFNWSSGKDAMLSLHYILKDKSYRIDRLLTTVNEHHQRVTMHGLRKDLLVEQTNSLGIPLDILKIPENPSMETYNALMRDKISELRSHGYTYTFFGDIFLEDLKKYRENMLAGHQIKPIFPIWKKDTRLLMKEFIQLGFKAVIVCIDKNKLDDSFLGAEINEALIKRLPTSVDLCGENGEFHTFCYDGPIFQYPVKVKTGEKVTRYYDDPVEKDTKRAFGFCDILNE